MNVDAADDQDHLKFFATYDEPQSGILTYLDERRTSGPVEGLNNKARVITKRRYGVRNTQNLWNRLCLDVNLAALAVSFTVTQIHEIASHIRAVYLNYYTWKRKSLKIGRPSDFVVSRCLSHTPILSYCEPSHC